MGSVVVAHGFRCPEVCGIFLDQLSNPCPRIGRQILKHWTTREVLPSFVYQNFPHPIPSVSVVLSPPYLVNPSIPHVHLSMPARSVMSDSLQSHGL